MSVTPLSPVADQVAVLCPSRGLIVARALRAVLADLAEAERTHAVRATWFLIDGLSMPDCRHACVREMRRHEAARGRRFDYVLWWDDDQAPPRGTLSRYIEVLAAAEPCVAMITGQTWVERNGVRQAAVTPLKPSDAAVQYARGSGLFYALIRREVFDDFDVELLMTASFGEDWQWTTRLVSRGRRILLLPDIEIAHLRVTHLHDRDGGWNGVHTIEAQ